MRLQIASNQCITLSDISLDIFEPPNMRDLFRKDAMQLGIDAVTVGPNGNESRVAASIGSAVALIRALRVTSENSCV